MTQDQLYESEATLRLVDRVLQDLDMSDRFRPSGSPAPGYRAEQLRGETVDPDDAPDRFLRAFWEIHDALELLRDSHAALRPAADAPQGAVEEQRERLDRALAMVDGLCGDDADPARLDAQNALRDELIALADDLRSREAVQDRLHHTAGLLIDLEGRLAHLARVFGADPRGPAM